MNDHLTSLLAEVFGLREVDIRPDLNKSDIGSWDSLKQMDLVMSLEREYGIVLEIPDILKMTSIRAIIDVLTDKGINLAD